MKKKIWLSLFIVISFITYAILQSLSKVSNLFGGFDEEREGGRADNNKTSNIISDTTSQTVTVPAPSNAVAVSNNNQTNQSRNTSTPTKTTTSGGYKDGQYIGDTIDVYYGNVQVKAIVQSGKLTDIQFLDYPRDRQTSLEIANMSLPILRSEAISAQSAKVDGVSGATETSRGFILSLQSALAKAL